MNLSEAQVRALEAAIRARGSVASAVGWRNYKSLALKGLIVDDCGRTVVSNYGYGVLAGIRIGRRLERAGRGKK